MEEVTRMTRNGLNPKFITFDCYGTLTHFRMSALVGTLFSDRVPAGRRSSSTISKPTVSTRCSAHTSITRT